MSVPLPPKKEVALALLERSSVHLHLDPRAAGVVVPSGFKKQPQLVLQVGLNMPVPIHDLRLDEAGMSCTLSFNRSPFYCVVPWGSVYAMVGDDGRGMVWPDDVPPEVEQQARGREGEAVAAKKATVKRAPDPDARSREVAIGERPTPEAGTPRQAGAISSKPKKPRKRGRAEADSVGAPNGVGAAESPARATLVAVPAIAPKKESPAAIAPAPRPPPRIVSGDRRPNAAPRAKRELPPYLRVVK